jgi:hypothetical protein
MIEVSIGWILKLERSETNVIQSLIVNAESLIGIFDKLVNRKCSIVRLNYGIRYL